MEEKSYIRWSLLFKQEINVKGYYFGKTRERTFCLHCCILRGMNTSSFTFVSKLVDVLKK